MTATHVSLSCMIRPSGVIATFVGFPAFQGHTDLDMCYVHTRVVLRLRHAQFPRTSLYTRKWSALRGALPAKLWSKGEICNTRWNQLYEYHLAFNKLHIWWVFTIIFFIYLMPSGIHISYMQLVMLDWNSPKNVGDLQGIMDNSFKNIADSNQC
jgi:hypothetical protein